MGYEQVSCAQNRQALTLFVRSTGRAVHLLPLWAFVVCSRLNFASIGSKNNNSKCLHLYPYLRAQCSSFKSQCNNTLSPEKRRTPSFR